MYPLNNNTVSLTRICVHCLDFRVSDEPAQWVDEAKLLGLVLDTHLSLTDHIHSAVRKMGQGLAVTRACSPYV